MSNWRFLISLFCIFGLVSCVNTTKIQAVDKFRSVDKSVSIYIDGLYKGSGEVFHSDNNIFRPAEIILKKDQCEDIKTELHFESNILRAAGGGVFGGLVGLLLVGREQTFKDIISLGSIPSTLILMSAFILLPATFGYLLGREYKDVYIYDSKCIPLKSKQ